MNYIKGVAQEMKKVTWPSMSEVNYFTWIVIIMIVFFSLFFALTDVSFSTFIEWFVGLAQ